MASIKPKPPPILIPDLGNSEKSFCRLCLVNNIGHLELLHHNISAPHIKKLKAHIRLRSQCMICPVYMSDIKAAEAHVQDSRHELRMNHDLKLKSGAYVDQKYKCPPCCLVFNSSIALELHLFMTHKVAFSTENLPDLSEIIWLLSGSSADFSKVSINPECVICEVNFEAMDDFLMHLFSNVHMKSLRTSTCLVCDLKFIHVNDREGHLHAWKHRFNLQKVCLSNRLKKLKDVGQGENTGYICMYCMIWCRSWPCFMLHLLGSAHRLFSENQEQQHTSPLAHAELQAENWESKKDAAVSSISERNRKRWLDHSTGLSVWCFACEEMFSTPEALEKHLECHHGLQSIHMKKRDCFVNSLSTEGKVSDYFECEVCCVIFKNFFSLTVHKSHRQHHIQQAWVSNGGVLCHCFDCRTRARSTATEKIIFLKSNSISFNGCNLEENVITVQNHCSREFISKANKESSDKSSNSSECQEKMKVVSENVMLGSFSGLGNSNVSVQRQSSDCKKILANVSQITREPSNKVFKSLSNTIEKDTNFQCGVNEKNGKMVSQIFDTMVFKDNPGESDDPEASEPGEKTETVANHQTNEQLSGCPEKNGTVCQGLTQSGIFTGHKEIVPVVIAAALPPSESIDNSIHSALRLVRESLSAAVPKIRKSCAEMFSTNKRLKGNNCDTSMDKHDCSTLQTILESAVCEGLQSIISQSSLPEASTLGEKSDCNGKRTQKITSSTCVMPTGSGVSPMSICVENVEGVSVALAAAVIPQFSITEVALLSGASENHPPITSGDDEKGNETMKEKTCVGYGVVHETKGDHQDIKCVHDEKLPRQDSTQQLNIVYEEDSSSDSDDHRVYLSSIDTESSED